MVVPARPPSFLIPEGEPEWVAMWIKVAGANRGDPVCEDPGTRECWQYLGTWWNGFHFRHHFRHRQLRGQRHTLSVPTSTGWEPADGLTPEDAMAAGEIDGVTS